MVRDPALEQISRLIPRIAPQRAAQRFFRREVQDTLASQPVSAAFGHPQPQQAMPFAAAALGATRIPPGRVPDADHDADMAADGAFAREFAVGELRTVMQPSRGDAAPDGPPGPTLPITARGFR
nr:hypothetical protein [uncultured Rhodopila sp.]